jgi:putative transmembrane protein PGPGW
MIDQFIQFTQSWISNEMWVGLIVFSVIAFVCTLIAIPAILIRLPPDYFKNHHHKPWFANHHPVIRTLGLLIKNLAGIIFLLAGIAMLFLPGQGLLTMLLGVLFIDFPGKHRLEQKLIQHPQVLKAINAFREKSGKPPFTFD